MYQIKEVINVATKKSIELSKIKRYRGVEKEKCINNIIVHSRDSISSI